MLWFPISFRALKNLWATSELKLKIESQHHQIYMWGVMTVSDVCHWILGTCWLQTTAAQIQASLLCDATPITPQITQASVFVKLSLRLKINNRKQSFFWRHPAHKMEQPCGHSDEWYSSLAVCYVPSYASKNESRKWIGKLWLYGIRRHPECVF